MAKVELRGGKAKNLPIDLFMPSRNRRGWMSPANRRLTPISFRVPQETVQEFLEAAAIAGLSQRQAFKRAVAEFAERQRDATRAPLRFPRRAAAHTR